MSLGSFTGVEVLLVKPNVIDTIYAEKKISIDQVDIQNPTKISSRNWREYPNLFVVLSSFTSGQKTTALARVSSDAKHLHLLKDYSKSSISGLRPRNKEQNMLLNTLMDDSVSCQVITGKAGSGKTLCTIAAAFQRVFEDKESPYSNIILTRPMDPVGRTGLGALPGDANEKFTPYLVNFFSNFSFLFGKNGMDYLQTMVEKGQIQCIPIQLIGGASFSSSFIIADEIQSLNEDEMYALGTRAGEDSKLVLMGDYRQRYGKKINANKTGLYKLMNSPFMKRSSFTSAIELIKQERSPVAGLFTSIFDEEIPQRIREPLTKEIAV